MKTQKRASTMKTASTATIFVLFPGFMVAGLGKGFIKSVYRRVQEVFFMNTYAATQTTSTMTAPTAA